MCRIFSYLLVSILVLFVFTSSNTRIYAEQKEFDPAKAADAITSLSLIPYEFGAKAKFKITGGDFFSIYSVRVDGNQMFFSGDIPTPLGEIQPDKGFMWNIGGPVTNGYIWTPRVERLNNINLAIESKIIDLPGFDFESFRVNEVVIAFQNGYGINLYGAVIEDRTIIKEGSEQTYMTKNGEKLYGRVIYEKIVNGKRVLEEKILKPTAENKDSRAIEPLILALKNGDSAVRQDAAEALGEIKDPRAVEPLIATLKDNDPMVRQKAVLSLGNLNDPRSVEHLITALKDKNNEVRWAAKISLQYITGQDFGEDPTKWQEWWEKNKAKRP